MSKKEKKSNPVPSSGFAIPPANFRILIAGVVILVIGFLLMVGGKADNPNEFHPEELFSFRRLTLSPIVILLGFGVVFVAIMRKPRVEEEPEEEAGASTEEN